VEPAKDGRAVHLAAVLGRLRVDHGTAVVRHGECGTLVAVDERPLAVDVDGRADRDARRESC